MCEEQKMNFDEMIGKVKEAGALNAAVIPAAELVFDPAFREMCRSNACGNYGMCWMCPPDAADPAALIAAAKEYKSVLVYQTVSEIDDSYDFEGMMKAADRHNALASVLSDYFSSLPFRGMLHLGAGGCHICSVCAKKTNEPCRFPERAMPSLEVYCINVSALASSAGMKYINGANTVTYFDALLFTGE